MIGTVFGPLSEKENESDGHVTAFSTEGTGHIGGAEYPESASRSVPISSMGGHHYRVVAVTVDRPHHIAHRVRAHPVGRPLHLAAYQVPNAVLVAGDAALLGQLLEEREVKVEVELR